MSACEICIQKFTKTNRQPIKCLYCDFTSCKECVKGYLLTQQDPNCMKCNKSWNDEFIDSTLTKNFRNGELKKHRQNILFEREQSLLPASMSVLSKIREDQAKIKELRVFIEACQQQMYECQRQINYIENGGGSSETRKEFIRKCPAEGCRGFLSTQWKCGICEKFTCKECLEIKSKDHVCDPNNVETAKLIKIDSKPCPTCGTYIYKTYGCSQMFCTSKNCGTAFDWNTGKIVTGRIHNPHYYEFLRNNNGQGIRREQGDILCGGLPDYSTVWNAIYDENYKDYTMNIHRFVSHARLSILPEYISTVNAETNQDLRFDYLENKISKEQWKQKLFQREKKHKFKTEMYQLYDMFVNVAEEAFRKLVNDERSENEQSENEYPIKDFLKELESLREYVNKSAKNISKRYSYQVIVIDSPTREETRRRYHRHPLSIWNEHKCYDN